MCAITLALIAPTRDHGHRSDTPPPSGGRMGGGMPAPSSLDPPSPVSGLNGNQQQGRQAQKGEKPDHISDCRQNHTTGQRRINTETPEHQRYG